ncbi:SLOG family protein [Acutalibacter sp. 1XD8-33]|uniref:SLOG family protein n=1 Tax=Acutalibacter sp. 1XD8-33 TaxID=2320081 RepID=UPI001314E4B0|nr:SLOG family protein [Acutalibacter sp. 1XD8-33]
MGVQIIREKTCCFTGHRHLAERDSLWIRRRIREEAAKLWREQGVDTFLAGGALGFDTMAAQEVLHLKEDLEPRLKLILVLPFPGQESRWTQKQQLLYRALLSQADESFYTGDFFSRESLLLRDRYLVEHSAHCLCYLDQRRRNGGTSYTVRYALANGLNIVNLAPAPPDAQDPFL